MSPATRSLSSSVVYCLKSVLDFLIGRVKEQNAYKTLMMDVPNIQNTASAWVMYRAVAFSFVGSKNAGARPGETAKSAAEEEEGATAKTLSLRKSGV